MTKQKRWTLIGLTGFVLICIGFIVLGIATQGASFVTEIIGLSGMFMGFFLFTYGYSAKWLHKKQKEDK